MTEPGSAPALEPDHAVGRPGRSTASGPGRVLVLVYAVLAVSATARSVVQIGRDLATAPVAYLLSAFAALVYVTATVALAKGTGRWRVVAWVAVGIEAVGVVLVGALSLLRPDLFPESTVWSELGAGYGFVPLVLPALGLLWLARTRPTPPTAGR